MPLTQDTNREREALEAHWIALLHWLAQQKGLSVDELIESFDADMYLSAKQRLDKESHGRPDSPWTVLSFLDFGRFSEVAGYHGVDLEQLGNPPRDWKTVLTRHTEQGLVRYRNHLAHGNRFGLLPDAEQAEALTLFREQRRCLAEWWPQSPTNGGRRLAGSENPFRPAIRELSSDPNDTASLVRSLGFRFVANAPNLVPPSLPTDLARALAEYVTGLHRVGEATLADGSQVGFYVAYVSEWKERSSERERDRRKIAKAIVDYQSALDPRRLVLLLDSQGRSTDAELLLPRTTARGLTSTVRAALSLHDPNHYHVELLEDISLMPGMSLAEVTRRWNEAFSVERVTKRFYEEFAALRDRLIDDLLANNSDNPALAGRDRNTDSAFNLQLHAFGTRQLGRLLFLWFLQQKRWLGGSPGYGETNFLVKAFRERGDTGYFNDVLVPLYFDGLGRRVNDPKHRAVEAMLGALPYLGGGLFRPGADPFERRLFGMNDDGEPTIRVVLPDDLFDPTKDDVEVGTGRNRRRLRTALGLLRGYRFTTQESTPDDQSVDPDPELLGKVFENLYQADERHQTGAYYTPREVVHFMCRETLDGYLQEKTGVDKATIDRIRRSAIDWEEGDTWLETGTGERLHAALDEVRILDPAVGSGAFLLAAMQEIVLLKRGIEISELGRHVDAGSSDVATWKQRIAVNGLFGVDLNPMAVEICHLRLWLSMLVDLNINDFRDLPALPNLDFRVVAGDSLIDRMGERPFMQSLPRQEVQLDMALVQEVNRLQAEINTLRQRFEGEGTATGDVRRLAGLKEQIRAAQVGIARLQLDHELELARGTLATLENPGPGRRLTQTQLRNARSHVAYLERLQEGLTVDAPSQKPFLWPVNFYEVLEGGGFDIVLANPPYVRQEGLDAADQTVWSHAFPEVHAGTADILVYFLARAVQVIRPDGQLAFITSNKYFRSDCGEGLRGFLALLSLHAIIDFGHLPVFNADVMSAVLIAQKTSGLPDNQYLFARLREPIRIDIVRTGSRVSVESVRNALGDLSTYIERYGRSAVQSELKREGWAFVSPVMRALLSRLKEECKTFSDITSPSGVMQAGEDVPYYGIKTGFNDAYVINEETRRKLLSDGSSDLIKPWIRGRDIGRWVAAESGLYILAVQNSDDADAHNAWSSAKSEAEARELFRRAHPAIYDHLSQYESRLRSRSDQGKWWWELRACAYYEELHRPKVVWRDIGYVPHFAFDTSGAYVGNTCFFSAHAPKWVVAVLNSSVFEWIASTKLFEAKDAYLRWLPSDLASVPIPTVAVEEQRLLEKLVDKAAASEGLDAGEQEMQQVVMRLYGLTAEEQLNYKTGRRYASVLRQSRVSGRRRQTARRWSNQSLVRLLQNVRAQSTDSQ